jgi:hypothetical protein
VDWRSKHLGAGGAVERLQYTAYLSKGIVPLVTKIILKPIAGPAGTKIGRP